LSIKSQKDFYSGLLFLVIGAAFAYGATKYSIGTGARMGPGYFPRMLGVLLAVLGAFVVFEALTIKTPDGEKVGTWAWKPLVFIILANLGFGVLLGGLPSIGLPAMGLIAGIFFVTIVASMASDEFKFTETLVLSVVLSIISYLAFIMLLKLQFPVWPAFITG
jgi:hypothetical protein